MKEYFSFTLPLCKKNLNNRSFLVSLTMVLLMGAVQKTSHKMVQARVTTDQRAVSRQIRNDRQTNLNTKTEILADNTANKSAIRTIITMRWKLFPLRTRQHRDQIRPVNQNHRKREDKAVRALNLVRLCNIWLLVIVTDLNAGSKTRSEHKFFWIVFIPFLL